MSWKEKLKERMEALKENRKAAALKAEERRIKRDRDAEVRQKIELEQLRLEAQKARANTKMYNERERLQKQINKSKTFDKHKPVTSMFGGGLMGFGGTQSTSKPTDMFGSSDMFADSPFYTPTKQASKRKPTKRKRKSSRRKRRKR